MEIVLAIVESHSIESLLNRTLRGRYSLTVCCSTEEGGGKLQQSPDVLILDLRVNGSIDLLEQHTTSLPRAVIVLTPVCSQAVMQKADQLGADFLIRIPCTGAAVLSALDVLLCKKDPSRSGG